MRVFLDVGANTGQSLAAVRDPALGFDRIVCFEPAQACWRMLERVSDLRVQVKRFGLWNQTCKMPIFQPGSLGAGMWKKDKGRSNDTETCQFRKASDWFRENVSADDTIFLKLNVEGAECDILDDLLDSGEFEKVSFVMIDFDVRKISEQKHREAELRARLAAFGFPRVAYCKDVMRGDTHQDRIKNWLRLVAEA